jgi:hypothetical protein
MLQPAEQTRRRVAACLASLATALIVVAAQTPVTPDVWGALTFRHVGPQGNRVVAVAGIPGDANVLYAGAASGGIFKSMDAGVHWMPIFDGQIVASIGALAVAPSDPNVVWAGTGEAFIRGNISIGNGAYKSTDAGRTWTHSGLDATGRIGRVVIHPTDPDIVFVAAMGHCYGPQPERGVFRTLDGGKTWDRVLFVDEHTGAIDIVVEPSNPRILFASTWQLIIRPWGRESGGPGSGLYMSRDGGTTWTRLKGRGLPDSPLGVLVWRSRRATPTASTRSSRAPLARGSCGGPTTEARTGCSSAVTTRSIGGPITTRAWQYCLTTPTKCTSSPSSSCTCPSTAVPLFVRSGRSGPTTTTCGSTP